jgi:GT2 family glycosyltransferase
VSIVVLTHDGLEHLQRLMPRLMHTTDYPELELIVVDNASADGSADYLRSLDVPFPLTIVANEQNEPFADANNEAAEGARHEHLLLLNNDIEPFEPGWLKELVVCMRQTGAAAVGATLLHAAYERLRKADDHLVQHKGIEFARQGTIVPVAAADGRPLSPLTGPDVRKPGCTAGCLLIRREALRAVGGFTTGFLWGWEDVDLGLKLTDAGEPIVCSGRSVLFHHESSTRLRHEEAWRRRNLVVNRRLLTERWGPQVRREYTLERFTGGGFWTDGRAPHAAFPLAGGARDLPVLDLADALEREGWMVTLLRPDNKAWKPVPRGADFVVVSDPAFAGSLPIGAECVAWVQEPVQPWLDSSLLRHAELVLAGHPSVASPLEAAGVAAVPFPGAGALDRRPHPIALDRELDCLVIADRDGLTPESTLALEGQDLSTRVVGTGWQDEAAAPEVLGDLPLEARPELYAAARLVVCESPASGATGPAVASTILDALFAGALPLSDDAAVLEALFGDSELAWSSADGLRDLVRSLLDDEPRRVQLVERHVARALEHHTWQQRARELVELLGARTRALRFCVKCDAREGSLHAAAALRASLERRGHTCFVELPDEWSHTAGYTADVAVVLGDPGRYLPKPCHVNVLVTADLEYPEQCDIWDLVLVGHAGAATRLRSETATPVAVLDVAAEPDPAARLLPLVEASAGATGVRPLVGAQT